MQYHTEGTVHFWKGRTLKCFLYEWHPLHMIIFDNFIGLLKLFYVSSSRDAPI